MKVTFVLPGISKRATGGNKIVFEYANRLVGRGHEITIVFWCDIPNTRLGKLPGPMWSKRLINRVRNVYQPRWFPLDSRVHKVCAFAVDDMSVPDGDWVFATAVQTARGVASLSEGKGKKGYLIQDYETWDASEEEVRETYRFGMTNVVISKWLYDIVESVAPNTAHLISNPVDTAVFYDDGRGRNPNQVSVLYHEQEHKGFKYAYEALRLAKERVPDLHVEAFGVFDKPSYFPDWFTYTHKATPEQLRRIYSGSAAYVCASVNEGFGLTGLEALACGAALASTDYAGVHDYAIDGENALLSPTCDPEALADNLVAILCNPALRDRLGHRGAELAKGLSWDRAVDELENLLVISDASIAT